MRTDWGVLVEFVGLPAVGKTRLAREVKSQFEKVTWVRDSDISPNVSTSTEKREDKHRVLTPGRYVLSEFRRAPRLSLRSFRVISGSHQPSRRYELRYFGYLLYLVGEIRRARTYDAIYLADQGFFQHLWRIELTGEADKVETHNALCRLHGPVIIPDVVVFVSADHSVRMQRAKRRGTDFDPALFDPDHPLIRQDHRAFETIREFVPKILDDLTSETVIVDIDNSPDKLRQNVSEIVTRIEEHTIGSKADPSEILR